MIIAADISMVLEQQGYDVMGLAPRGEMAIEMVKNDAPDLVLNGYQFKREIGWDRNGKSNANDPPYPYYFPHGQYRPTPPSSGPSPYKPYAFLGKPFNPTDLTRTLELALDRIRQEKPVLEEQEDNLVMGDRIFVKHKDRMVKVPINEILFITAESNYCRIVTAHKEYVLSLTLKAFEERLQAPEFMRVHRSHLINLDKIDEVGEVYLKLGKHQVPYSKSYKEELYRRLKMI